MTAGDPGRSGRAIADRLSVDLCWAPADQAAVMADEVRRGLTSKPKTLPSKYFYDDRGSELFEEITRLDEYYQTRTEQRILEAMAGELVMEFGFQELVEIGSGSSTKTRILLDAMERGRPPIRYVALDISEQMLRESALALLERYPLLRVHAVVGDFSTHLGRVPPSAGRRLVIFLGSTIGNLDVGERRLFLKDVRGLLEPGDCFLLGLDLVKDVARLEAAYNDAAGVTAAFNANILRVINRGLGGDFVPEAFRHHALYNRAEDRIEMHLLPQSGQTVTLRRLSLVVRVRADETIRTEISCKFTRSTASEMLADAGLRLERWYTDAEGLFGLALAGMG